MKQTFTLPDYWAHYLINGDSLNDADDAAIAKFLKQENLLGAYCTLDATQEAFFARKNDANNMGGNCYEYTFIRPKKVKLKPTKKRGQGEVPTNESIIRRLAKNILAK